MSEFTQTQRRTSMGGLAGVIAVILLWVIPGTGQTESPARGGEMVQAKEAFVQYCATCHGRDAKGNGPMAATLKKEPPNLTQLSKKNGGEFPAQHVLQTIDGQAEMRSHGTRDMPVWGVKFKEEIQSGDAPGMTSARLTISVMAAYLELIQED